jgi:hypothetical protein
MANNNVNMDFALNGNDLYIVDGDIAIAESDNQHIADTLNAFPGWWKENPQDGVGIFQYLNSSGQEQLIRKNIMMQLQSDGYNVSNPIVSTDVNGQLNIIPNASI